MANTVSNVTIAALDSLVIGGTTMGYTGAPFTVSSETVREKFYAEQSFVAIISQMTERNVTGGCQLLENTPENLAILWSLPAANVVTPGGSKILSIDTGDRGNVALTATGLAGTAPGSSKTRTFSFPQTTVSGAVETQMAKADISRLEATFDFLADSNGDVGMMTDTV